MAEAIQAHRAGLGQALGHQVAGIRSEIVEEATRRITGVEATVAERLDRLEERLERALAATGARLDDDGRVVGPEGRLEQARAGSPSTEETTTHVHEPGLRRLAAGLTATVAGQLHRAGSETAERLDAIEKRHLALEAALEAALEKQAEKQAEAAEATAAREDGAGLASIAESLRFELQDAITGQLATVKAEAVEAAAAKLDAAEDDLNDRLDAIDAIVDHMRAEAARVAALASATASPLAPLRSDITALRADVEALTSVVAKLERARPERTSRQMKRPEAG